MKLYAFIRERRISHKTSVVFCRGLSRIYRKTGFSSGYRKESVLFHPVIREEGMHSESVPSGLAFRKSVSKKYKFCKIHLDFTAHLRKMVVVPTEYKVTKGYPGH